MSFDTFGHLWSVLTFLGTFGQFEQELKIRKTAESAQSIQDCSKLLKVSESAQKHQHCLEIPKSAQDQSG